MKDKYWTIICGITTLIAVVFLIMTIAIPGCNCTGEQVMKCCYTMKVETWMGILLTIVSIFHFFLKSKDARRYGGVILILLALVSILLMTDMGTGLCMKSEMACRGKSVYLIICNVILIVMGIIQAVKPAQDSEKQKYGF